MKILQLVDSLRIGGAEMIAANLATALIARGHSCAICGIGDNGALESLLNLRNITNHCLVRPRGFSVGLMKQIAGLMRNTNSDVMISHHFRQLAHGLVPALLGRQRVIHIEHDYHFYENHPALVRRLSLLLRGVDAFVVVSREIGEWFRSRIPHVSQKIVVIENGVDCERFKPDPITRSRMRQRFRIDEKTIVIGTCARLEPVKNISLLLDGFAEFSQFQPDSLLCIVGDGSQMPHLKQQAAERSLTDRVEFAGICQVVEEYLALFDIYALTSRNEGLPVSVMEAMACGLPVVAANVGSLAELLSEETGLLLDAPTQHDLSNSFRYYSDNPALAQTHGMRGRNHIQQRFSLDVMTDHYEALLQQVDQ